MRGDAGRRALELLVAVATATLGAAGCGDRGADASGHVTIDTLAGGAVQVTSSAAGAWGEGEGWALREELRIGRPEGDGADVFGRVAAVEAAEDGRIYVLDGQAREVRIFGPDGSHLRTLGREGEGPGEFLNPVGLSVHPSDESLWVTDGRNARYTVFDPEGAFRTTHPRPLGFLALPWPGGFDEDGGLYDVGSDGGLIVVRYGPSMAPVDTFRIPELEEDRVLVTRSDGMPVMSVVSPLAPRLHWRFDLRGYIWTATSDRYHFTQQTLAGDTLRIVSRAHEPVPVTRLEADSVRASIEEVIAMNAGPDGRVEGELGVPDHKPAFRTFLVDRVGRLWVEPYRARGESRVLEVFEADGAYLGPIEVDPRLNLFGVLPDIGANHLHAVVTDELDIPHVVRYRIERGSPARGGM